ncbi:MAG: hypothetical protein Q9199_004264 [Rusavskia elegans]
MTSGWEEPNPDAKDVRTPTHPPIYLVGKKHQQEADDAEFGRFNEHCRALEKIPPQLRERQTALKATDVHDATKKRWQQELANLSNIFEAWHKEHEEIYAKISEAWSWE